VKAHPAADAFPLLEGKDLADLADDIRAHGLIEPIVTLDGKLQALADDIGHDIEVTHHGDPIGTVKARKRKADSSS
jgi:hypothetical protein